MNRGGDADAWSSTDRERDGIEEGERMKMKPRIRGVYPVSGLGSLSERREKAK